MSVSEILGQGCSRIYSFFSDMPKFQKAALAGIIGGGIGGLVTKSLQGRIISRDFLGSFSALKVAATVASFVALGGYYWLGSRQNSSSSIKTNHQPFKKLKDLNGAQILSKLKNIPLSAQTKGLIQKSDFCFCYSDSEEDDLSKSYPMKQGPNSLEPIIFFEYTEDRDGLDPLPSSYQGIILPVKVNRNKLGESPEEIIRIKLTHLSGNVWLTTYLPYSDQDLQKFGLPTIDQPNSNYLNAENILHALLIGRYTIRNFTDLGTRSWKDYDFTFSLHCKKYKT